MIFHQWLNNLQAAVYLQLSCASCILRLHRQQQIKLWASFAKEQKNFVNRPIKEFSQHTCWCWLIWLCARPNGNQESQNTFRASEDCVLTL